MEFKITDAQIVNGEIAIDIPKGTTYLDLSGCQTLVSLPENLPYDLESLNLNGCIALKSLPTNLTDNLDFLYLRGCCSLERTGELTNLLRDLEENECEIERPEHWLTPIERLIDSVLIYKASEPAGAPSTVELFKRFLREGLQERGGFDETLSKTQPFVDFISQDPEQLAWIEEIAKLYLDGCVNQPVNGFMKINAWMRVAQEAEIVDKINAARQLMIIDYIENFAAQNDKFKTLPDFNNIEVELGVMLIKEVHEMLIQDGHKAWNGLPDTVFYEERTEDLLNKKGIDIGEEIIAAYEIANHILSKPLEDIADYLLEKHGETWANIAFPEVKSEINQEYQPKRQKLEILSDPGLYVESKEETPLDPMDPLAEFKSKTNAQKEIMVKEIYDVLNNEEAAKIQEKIVKLTKEAIAVNAMEDVSGEEKEDAPTTNASKVRAVKVDKKRRYQEII
ncbi:MAG: disease resistance protein RPP4-like [Rickettsiaceae bacterium]|jgi:hypothetical protein|nr:disease resistance protein RPP4-like [Rickettsiaceae bacterium]